MNATMCLGLMLTVVVGLLVGCATAPASRSERETLLAEAAAEFTPAPLPPAAQALATWLDATSLSEYFFVRDFYAVNLTGIASCATERDREDARVLFEVLKARLWRLCLSTPLSILERIGIKDCWEYPGSSPGERTTGTEDIELVNNPCDPEANPLPILRSDVPTVLVRVHTTLNKDGLRALESDFESRFGATLWDRMFLKISSSLRLPQRQIVMHVPVFCTTDVVYWHNGSATRGRMECMSAGASILLASLPDLASSAHSSLAISIPKIGELIAPIIEKSYTTKGATVEFLERGGGFVEAIIRGLRGEVILGGKDWERVQVSIFALQGEKGIIQLRTLVDGRIASGLGSYPPDSSFTTDMEPRYSGALTEYARQLLDRIQTEFTRRGPNQ